MSLPNIAFIGKAGAGKTTAAELLTKHHGYERLSFAAPLKVMLNTTDDRHRLQEFGTNVVRAYEPDAWVNLFVAELDRQQRESECNPCPVVVDDARFGNEVARLRLEDFVIIRVVAPRNSRVLRLRANGKLQDEAQLEHVSETELDAFNADYTAVNDGDPYDLHRQLVDILNHEAGRR